MKQPKFKVGDRAKHYLYPEVECEVMELKINESLNGEAEYVYKIQYEDGNIMVGVDENSLEPREFTLSDLQDWDMVKLRDDEVYIVNLQENKLLWFFGLKRIITDDYFELLEDYTKDMKSVDDETYDIMIVKRNGEVIYSCKEKLKPKYENWKPEHGDTYYTPNFSFDEKYIGKYCCNSETDTLLYEQGLVFKTKEEAIEAAEKMLATLKED